MSYVSVGITDPSQVPVTLMNLIRNLIRLSSCWRKVQRQRLEAERVQKFCKSFRILKKFFFYGIKKKSFFYNIFKFYSVLIFFHYFFFKAWICLTFKIFFVQWRNSWFLWSRKRSIGQFEWKKKLTELKCSFEAFFSCFFVFWKTLLSRAWLGEMCGKTFVERYTSNSDLHTFWVSFSSPLWGFLEFELSKKSF